MAKDNNTQSNNSQQGSGNTNNQGKPDSYGTQIVKKGEDLNTRVTRFKE